MMILEPEPLVWSNITNLHSYFEFTNPQWLQEISAMSLARLKALPKHYQFTEIQWHVTAEGGGQGLSLLPTPCDLLYVWRIRATSIGLILVQDYQDIELDVMRQVLPHLTQP